jgi:hypothetical protein
VKNALSAERAEDRAIAADLAKGIVRPRRPAQEGAAPGGGLPRAATAAAEEN